MSKVLSPKDALSLLPQQAGTRFANVFNHGTLEVEIYAPQGTDPQQPHSRDEVYVVVSGSGTFVHGDQEAMFSKGDFIFVEAGLTHRFEDFTDDFAVWVMFYGPEGGEKDDSSKS